MNLIFVKQMLVAIGVIVCVVSVQRGQAGDYPNVIVILADDLGYGDLGCYGSKRNATPHIDALAKQGMLFTDFHSNGPMCSPTRAAFLTGLYQQRFGRKFERALGGRIGSKNGLPLEADLLPELLKKNGYATAMFGKWHLGNGPPFVPSRQGFDEFVGLLTGDGDHHTRIDRSGDPDWWNKEEEISEEGYTTDLITQHSTEFIRHHKDDSFFLLVSHLAIHFPWQGPQDPPQREKGRDYRGDKWGILPDRSNIASHVKAMIASLDASTGKIIATLRECNLDEQTLVIFTSDNGGYLDYKGGFRNISSNGPLRGQKTELWEGGHRVPFIAWWPGKIEPGTRSEEIAMTIDLHATILALAGIRAVGDGIDLGALLTGNADSLEERTLFWRMDESKAVREGKWKLISEGNETQLFDLDSDVGEETDLSRGNPEKVAALRKKLEEWEQEMEKGVR